MTYERHALSAAFPLMDNEEFQLLAEDIREHGLLEPGVLFEGKIIDGWHRYLACEKTGMDFLATEFQGDDPRTWVMSKNAFRRNLTASQRAAAIVLCSEWKPRGKPEPGSGLSEAAMAKAAGTSDRTIRQAKVAVKAGKGEAVRDGKISAKAAAESVKPAKSPTVEPEPMSNEGEDDAIDEANAAIAELYEIAEANEPLTAALETVKRQAIQIAHLTKENDRLMRDIAKATGQINYWKKKAPKS